MYECCIFKQFDQLKAIFAQKKTENPQAIQKTFHSLKNAKWEYKIKQKMFGIQKEWG